jgi:hypothetical protein
MYNSSHMYNLAEPKSIEATYMTWYSILYELSILKGFITWIIFFKSIKLHQYFLFMRQRFINFLVGLLKKTLNRKICLRL